VLEIRTIDGPGDSGTRERSAIAHTGRRGRSSGTGWPGSIRRVDAQQVWYISYVGIHVYIYVYIYVNTHTQTHTHVYIYVYIYVNTHTHTYTHTHEYSHTYHLRGRYMYVHTPVMCESFLLRERIRSADTIVSTDQILSRTHTGTIYVDMVSRIEKMIVLFGRILSIYKYWLPVQKSPKIYGAY